MEKSDEIIAGMESSSMKEGSLYESTPSFATVVRHILAVVHPGEEGSVDINLDDDEKRNIRINLAGPAAAVQNYNPIETYQLIDFFRLGRMAHTDLTETYWHINSLLQKQHNYDPTHAMLLDTTNSVYCEIAQVLKRPEFTHAITVIQEHFEQYGFIENIRNRLYLIARSIAQYTQPCITHPEHLHEGIQHLYNKYRERCTEQLLDVLAQHDYPMSRLQEMGAELRTTVDIDRVLKEEIIRATEEE